MEKTEAPKANVPKVASKFKDDPKQAKFVQAWFKATAASEKRQLRKSEIKKKRNEKVNNVNMNSHNIILGTVSILFGTALTTWEIRTFVKGQQSSFGWDVYGLGFGIICIICGIVVLNK